MGILHQLAALSGKELFGLSVLAALVTIVGNLSGAILKDILLARSFEKWKNRQTAFGVYKRLRDPLVLSSIELLSRMEEIIYYGPVTFLDAELLKECPAGPGLNSTDDPHFRKYKLISTVYRLCAWLGWTELYRQSLTFLDSGSVAANRNLEQCIRSAKADLADGELNSADDWEIWSDALIFREEQRAIGECMLVAGDKAQNNVLGYAGFCRVFDGPEPIDNNWLPLAANFILNLNISAEGKDFRRVRCLRLMWHLIAIVQLLAPTRVTPEMTDRRKEIETELKRYKLEREL